MEGKRHEYGVVEDDEMNIELTLNRLGKEGWRLVHFFRSPGPPVNYRVFLRREITT